MTHFSLDQKSRGHRRNQSVPQPIADNLKHQNMEKSGETLLTHLEDLFLANNVDKIEESPVGSPKDDTLQIDQVQTLVGHNGKVLTSDSNFDQSLLATAGQDRQIKIWDLQSFQCSKSIDAHSNQITCLKFSRSSNMLISGSFDKSVKVWNEDFETIETLLGHSSPVSAVDIHKNIICSCDTDGQLNIWNISQQGMPLISSTKIGSTVKASSFFPSSSLLLLLDNATFSVYDTNLFKVTFEKQTNQSKSHISFDFHPKKELFCIATVDGCSVWQNRNMIASHSLGDKISSVCMLDEHVLLGAYMRIFVWNWKSGSIKSIPAHDGMVSSIRKIGDSFITASHDGSIKIWKMSQLG